MATDPSKTTLNEAPLPERAWVVTTSKCNLNCLHCARSIPEFRAAAEATPDMTEEMFAKFEEQIAPSLRTVQFGGTNLGEPMMAPGFEGYVDRLRRFPGLTEVKLQTNGTYLLNPERLERIVRQGIRVMVSLEGVTEASYKKVRGVEFAHILRALSAFQEARARFPESSSELLLAFTVRYDTLNELVPLVELAARYGAKQVTVTHFVPVRESHRYQSLVYHRGEANAAFAAAEKRAKELGVDYVGPAPFRLAALDDGETETETVSEPPCFHPWTSVSINEQGDLMPCCATNTVMGNLFREDLRSIWNGRRYRKLRETINSSRPPAYCRGCLLRGVDLDARTAKLHTDPASLMRSIGSAESLAGRDLWSDGRRVLMRAVRSRLDASALTKRVALALRRFYWRHG